MLKNAESIIEIAKTIADIGDKSANRRDTNIYRKVSNRTTEREGNGTGWQ